MKSINRCLLIDDNELDQTLYRRIFRRSGMVGEIISFTMAEEALEYLSDPETPQIDAIFLDINMPRMNGFEFLEAAQPLLRERFKAVVIVMLTTSLAPEDLDRAENFGVVNDYFHKPLSIEHLERVASYLP